MKVVVSDIDGTLANCEHRRHHVRLLPNVPKKNRRWDLFNKGIPNDTVYEDVLWLYRLLHSSGCKMVLATGRNEDDRVTTEQWLNKHNIVFDALYMRKSKDFRDDSIVKEEILEQIKKEYGVPYLWLDDRSKVVDAIRKAGIRVLQVAPGDV